MLYVVSGFMRTGTSMMMRALEAGGLDAAYRQSREDMRARFADEHYDPNIGGLYELEPRDYRAVDFPRQFDGKLIKALNLGVPRMNVMPDGMRVVFMRRDAEEIRQSYLAFFNQHLANIETLDERMDNVIERIQNRRDIKSLHVFWYRSVVDQPVRHFEILAAAGWPIDAEAAASTVDPQHCRYRLENLTVGVI